MQEAKKISTKKPTARARISKEQKEALNSLRFERCMKIFYGDSAYQIAGSANNSHERKKWLKKIIKKITVIISNLDVPKEHTSLLMHNIEKLKEDIDHCGTQPNWQMIDSVFVLLGHIIGLHDGHHCYSLVYWQNENQYKAKKTIFERTESITQDSNIISTRMEVMKNLKANDHSYFEIACIMNMSEYQVQKAFKKTRTIQNIKLK